MPDSLDGRYLDGRRTVRILDACRLTGVSRRTIYNWLAADTLDYVRDAGGNVRIFEESLWRAKDGSRIGREED